MLTLNDRQIKIVEHFIRENNKYLTVEQIAREVNASSRTVRYDLEHIKAFLNEIDLTFKSVQKMGMIINLSNEDISRLNRKLYIDKHFSSEDRQKLIVAYMLLNTSTTTEELSDYLQVSKQTVINDLISVEDILNLNNLSVNKTKGKGITLVGNEFKIRKLFINLINDSKNNKWLIIKILDLIKLKIDLSKTNNFVDEIENKLSITFIDKQMIKIIIGYCIFRINQGHIMDEKFSTEQSISKIVESIVDNESEILYISNLINHERIVEDNTSNFVIPEKAAEISNILVNDLNSMYEVSQESKRRIQETLARHIAVAIYRIENGIKIKNELLNQIKISIPLIFEYTKKVLGKISTAYDLIFDENEVAYISMYIATLYEESVKTDNKVNVLISCSFGVATSSILKTRLLNLIPECNVFGPLPSHLAIDFVQKNKIDFVISTNEIIKGIDCIVINPLLVNDDIEKIKKMIFQKSYENMCSSFINSYSKIEVESSITSIKDIVDESNIQIVDHVDSWEKGIELAACLLVSKGNIEKRYVQKMISAVKELGTYMVILPEIAFVHAGTDDGINEDCVSILSLKKPIIFGDKNSKSVRNIFVLGVKNKDKTSLLDLVSILENKENRNRLNQCNSIKDILDIHN